MTRAQFCKELAERTDIPQKTVQQVIEAEENLIYEIIATCDSFKYVWGTISGIEKPPRRIGGKYREKIGVKRNFGWSFWKFGYPQIKWSASAKDCEVKHPQEYFELTEKRYTTMARTFRKDGGLPEIPEYQNLSEEKIKEICQKADEVELNSLTKAERANKLRDKKFNSEKKLAMIDYWEKTGYIPQGVVYSEELGDKNYTGAQRDTIDEYLSRLMKRDYNSQEKLNQVLYLKDLIEIKMITKPHPELDELEQQLRKEIEEQGLQPYPYIKRENGNIRNYNIASCTQPAREDRKKREMEKIKEELIQE